jgi:hypothetical protein
MVANGPDSDGAYTLNWRSEKQLWVDLGDTYANPTGTWTNWSRNDLWQKAIDDVKSDPDFACGLLADGGGSAYVYGQWA